MGDTEYGSSSLSGPINKICDRLPVHQSVFLCTLPFSIIVIIIYYYWFHEGLQSRLLLALTTDALQSSSLRLSKLLPHTANGVLDFRSCHDGRHTNTCMLKPIWEAALRLAKCCWWLSGWKVWGVSSPEETTRTEMMSRCYDDWQSTYIFPLPHHITAPSCGYNVWQHKYPTYFFEPKHPSDPAWKIFVDCIWRRRFFKAWWSILHWLHWTDLPTTSKPWLGTGKGSGHSDLLLNPC